MPVQRLHPRALIVEPDAAQRSSICHVLQQHYRFPPGGGVTAVATAAECLAQDLRQFDIVLQECQLPDMSGLDLLERILSAVDVPVIIVTGQNVVATAGEAIRRGAQDYVIKMGDYLFALPILVDKNLRLHEIKKENRRLQQELKVMLDELRVKNLQLEESLGKLQTMATTDHLTGLSNRRHFGALLERMYGQAVRYKFDLSCCMCDLDGLKLANDTMGHQVGDQVLCAAAAVIRSSLRSSDLAARYGGDEFVLLLPHTAMDRAIAVADRIRTELALPGRLPELRCPVTMSIGIASLRADDPTSCDELVAMADRALYAAKQRGKDRICAFHELGETRK